MARPAACVEMLEAPYFGGFQPRRGLCMGRLAAERCRLGEKRMASSARGDNTYYFISMSGRVSVDLMQVIKDDKKPEDNSLRFAADEWLGGGYNAKIDMSAAEMFAAFASRDPDRLGQLLEYCERDTEIPLRLIALLTYVPIWVEMSRVCYTPLQAVINSGQQVKVFNLIARFVHGEFALNVLDSGWPVNDYAQFDEPGEEDARGGEGDLKKRKSDYQGATVIEPQAGFYADPISTLDFASLYPSIIRYFNLCPSALVLDAAHKNLDKRVPGVSMERHTIDHNVLVGKDPVTREPQYTVEQRTYTFVTHVQGVLPRLLKRLLDARKAVKKLMAGVTDPLQLAVLNGRQLGIKTANNSVYGFCGVSADRGMLPCKPVAAVTTLKGRAFIEAARSYVEMTYAGSRVVYGGDFPLRRSAVARVPSFAPWGFSHSPTD